MPGAEIRGQMCFQHLRYSLGDEGCVARACRVFEQDEELIPAEAGAGSRRSKRTDGG
jgi:hypothetical protein